MPTLSFIHAEGRTEAVSAAVGESAMVAATRHGVTGIIGECGGNAMCATCHVYVEDSWMARLPAATDEEDGMLYGASAPRLPNSRLACQILVTPDLDGMVLRLPETSAGTDEA